MHYGAMINYLPSQPVTFVIWGIYRILMFPTFYSYIASTFGFKNYGKLVGIAFCIAGLFNFVQIPMRYFVFKLFDNNFFYPNLFFLVFRIFLFYVPFHLHKTREHH